ncbi:hypothetical protein QBC44DRAFT_320658 [Cladorrhinum sp. PSN332]|nr:hypothetical protein QBC44DRAFT_320658 [Cladorrhinum sp. PSN332]
MAWTETKPGVWQRPIGDNERFIKFIGDRAHKTGREHWSVTSGASFALNPPLEPSELEARCLEAWSALRFEHPSIACTANDEEGKLTYHVPSPDALKSWAKETFTLHGDTSADNVIASLKPSRYTTAHLLPSPEGKHQILLHLAHWRTDGFGALQLINSFLQNLFSSLPLPWGEEPCRLTPSIETILSLPATPTPEITTATSHYLQTLAHTRNAAGVSLSPGTESPSTLPQGTRGATFRFSPATTASIRSTCAANSFSLLSAVHAACALLTLELCPSEDKSYTSTIRLSLRPYLPAPYGNNNPAYAAGLYTGGYMFPLAPGTSFLDACKLYENEYKQGVTEDLLKSRREYAVRVLDIITKNQNQGNAVPPPVQSEIDISSVGDAEELVSSSRSFQVRREGGDKDVRVEVEVHDVLIGVETLTRQMYCFVWEFRGRLGLRIVYNEGYYTEERVKGMVGRLGEILVGGLGLE